MNENVMQHFRREEAPFIDDVTEMMGRAQNEYRPVLTHFLNPRQQYIVQTLLNGSDEVEYRFNGGYRDAEMKRALIYPNYYEPEDADFSLTLFTISYPVKFAELHHSSILGTLLGTGVERNVLGDILTDGENWQVFVEEDMANYISSQIDRIGKIKARLVEADIRTPFATLNEWETMGTTVASLRLDTIVATGYNLSRHRAKGLIEGGQVRLNWAEQDKPDTEVSMADIVSVRGFGRIRLDLVEGRTRKDKIRVTLAVLKK